MACVGHGVRWTGGNEDRVWRCRAECRMHAGREEGGWGRGGRYDDELMSDRPEGVTCGATISDRLTPRRDQIYHRLYPRFTVRVLILLLHSKSASNPPLLRYSQDGGQTARRTNTQGDHIRLARPSSFRGRKTARPARPCVSISSCCPR